MALPGAWSDAFIHDVDGDGRRDLLLGGPGLENVAPPPSVEGQPYGDHEGLVLFTDPGPGRHGGEDAEAFLYGTCFGGWGGGVSVGDVTGDCRSDFLANSQLLQDADGVRRGGALLLSELHRAHGRIGVLKAASAVILGEPWAEFGSQATFVGDLDGDGYAEIAIAGHRDFGNGAVYLFRGPIAGVVLASEADLVLQGSGRDAYFGHRLSGGRDVDGDGVGDLIVGAFGSSWYGPLSGAAYVFSGQDLVDHMP